ncbi:RNA polymerase sigma factor [Pseudomonadota bacterium]
MDEDSLINKALESDHGFRVLVIKYTPYMRVVACAIVGELQSTDVVQEAWVSIYKALPKFERRSSLKTWITSITANTAKGHLRKQSRLPLFESLSDEVSGVMRERFDKHGNWSRPISQWDDETPEALLSNDELMACIRMILMQLPEQQRAALSLKLFDGLPLSEICNILGVSASNVRVLVHRARHKLLEHVEHFQVTGQC